MIQRPASGDAYLTKLADTVNAMSQHLQPTPVGWAINGTSIAVKLFASSSAPVVRVHVQSSATGEGGAIYDPVNFTEQQTIDCREGLLQDAVIAGVNPKEVYTIFLIPIQYDLSGTEVVYDGGGGRPDRMAVVQFPALGGDADTLQGEAGAYYLNRTNHTGVEPVGAIPNLPASIVTSGTFDDARIPNLNASKITAGELPVVRGGSGLGTLASGQIPYGAGTSPFGSSANLSYDGTRLRSLTQPYFAAENNTNSGTRTAVAQMPFPTAVLNVGSHYDAPNWRFTAPVAGRYFFAFNARWSSGVVQMRFRVNSAQVANYYHLDSAGTINGFIVRDLAANDIVDVVIISGVVHDGWGQFYGGLLV